MEASGPTPDPVKKSNKIVFYVLGAVLAIVIVVAAVLLLTKQSESEKALAAVCTSRADIEKRVNSLASTSITNFTVNGFKENINGIQTDLNTIKDNQSKLEPNRKAQIEAANTAFTNSLKSTASDLGTSLSVSNAKAKITAAGQQLVASYKSTLQPVDCNGVDTSS
jgi:hypothetical protein